MRKQVILFFSGLFFSGSLLAQQRIDWAKYDSLAFKEDTISSPFQAIIKDGFIQPITQSDAKLEFRAYMRNTFRPNLYTIYVIKIYNNTCLLQKYFCNKGVFYPISMFPDSIGKDIMGRYLQRRVANKNADNEGSEIFKVLIENNVFTMPDQTKLIDILKSKGVQINNPCAGINDCIDTPIYCEVRFDNKVRNFNIRSVDYYLTNPECIVSETFKNNHNINLLLRQAFPFIN